jgi:hypothetical protein
MKSGWDDPERDLRKRFEALRLSDAALAGSFDASWRAARRRLDARSSAGLSRRRVLFAVAGVTSVVAAAAALVLTFSPPRPSIEEAIAQARELQSWSAPTDSLLTTADFTLSGTVPVPAPGSREPLDSSVGVPAPHLQ